MKNSELRFTCRLRGRGCSKHGINRYVYIYRPWKQCRGEVITHRNGIAMAMIVYDSKRRVCPFPARCRVVHDYFLVLVFAATRKDSALRTNQQGADAMLVFLNVFFLNSSL